MDHITMFEFSEVGLGLRLGTLWGYRMQSAADFEMSFVIKPARCSFDAVWDNIFLKIFAPNRCRRLPTKSVNNTPLDNRVFSTIFLKMLPQKLLKDDSNFFRCFFL